MNDAELARFLDRPLTAVVSTTGREGAPHAVPVWYRFDGESLRVWTGERRVWVRNVLRDPRASVTVAEAEAPFAAALLRCTATVATGESWIADEVRRITERYVPAAQVDAYLEQWDELQTVVTFLPERTVSWARGC